MSSLRVVAKPGVAGAAGAPIGASRKPLAAVHDSRTPRPIAGGGGAALRLTPLSRLAGGCEASNQRSSRSRRALRRSSRIPNRISPRITGSTTPIASLSQTTELMRGETLERPSGRLGTRTLGEARIQFPQARHTNEPSRSDQCTIGAAAGGAAVGGVGVRGAGEPVVSGTGFLATFM
jgi:hypothetical protein